MVLDSIRLNCVPRKTFKYSIDSLKWHFLRCEQDLTLRFNVLQQLFEAPTFSTFSKLGRGGGALALLAPASITPQTLHSVIYLSYSLKQVMILMVS